MLGIIHFVLYLHSNSVAAESRRAPPTNISTSRMSQGSDPNCKSWDSVDIKSFDSSYRLNIVRLSPPVQDEKHNFDHWIMRVKKGNAKNLIEVSAIYITSIELNCNHAMQTPAHAHILDAFLVIRKRDSKNEEIQSRSCDLQPYPLFPYCSLIICHHSPAFPPRSVVLGNPESQDSRDSIT